MLSVIIINYNTPELTLNCVESLYENCKDENFETIIVDNNSTNKVSEDDYKNFPNLKIIFSKENTGFTGGNNLGLKYANGDLILLLNSDTIIQDNIVGICSQKFYQLDNCAVLSPKIFNPPNNYIQQVVEMCPSIWLELRELLRINKFTKKEKLQKIYKERFFDYNKEIDCDWTHGTAMFISKKVIDKEFNGKLPDNFFMYAEDMLWCLLLKKKGYKIWFTPQSHLLHLGGKSMQDEDETQKYFRVMFPNTYKAIEIYKGKFYTKILFLIKVLHLCSLRNKKDFYKAKQMLKQIF